MRLKKGLPQSSRSKILFRKFLDTLKQQTYPRSNFKEIAFGFFPRAIFKKIFRFPLITKKCVGDEVAQINHVELQQLCVCVCVCVCVSVCVCLYVHLT